MISTFIVLTLPGIGLVSRIPLWLTVCLISRDITIVLTVIVVNLAIGRRTFRPTLLGKVATGVYILTGLVFLVVNYLGRPSVATDVMVSLSLIITIISALHYIRHAGRIISEGT